MTQEINSNIRIIHAVNGPITETITIRPIEEKDNKEIAALIRKYNPQNEMFRLLGTKRSFSQNETFFFSHPYPALFRLISHF